MGKKGLQFVPHVPPFGLVFRVAAMETIHGHQEKLMSVIIRVGLHDGEAVTGFSPLVNNYFGKTLLGYLTWNSI